MGRARHSRRGRRFRSALVGENRDQRRTLPGMAGDRVEQVLPLAQTLRLGQRTQRLAAARLLVGGMGKASHHRLLSPASAGRLSSPDLHDARRRHCGGLAHERLASAEPRRAVEQVEPHPVGQGSRLRRAPKAPSTLVYRRFLHQRLRDFLLLGERARRLQPGDRGMEFARVDERNRYRNLIRGGHGEAPPGAAARDLRQRPAAHRRRLQRSSSASRG